MSSTWHNVVSSALDQQEAHARRQIEVVGTLLLVI